MTNGSYSGTLETFAATTVAATNGQISTPWTSCASTPTHHPTVLRDARNIRRRALQRRPSPNGLFAAPFRRTEMPELRFVVGDEVEELAARLREITPSSPSGFQPSASSAGTSEAAGEAWSYNGGSLSYFSQSSTSRPATHEVPLRCSTTST
jgi:hypothetical protein